MKAMKNWMNKPWTWGTCFKLSGIVAGVYCALFGTVLVWQKLKEHKELEEYQKANKEEYKI